MYEEILEGLADERSENEICTLMGKKSGPGRSWSNEHTAHCGVLNCTSCTASCPDLWFFSLPHYAREPLLRMQWLKLIGRSNIQPMQRLLVCEKHFASSVISGKRKRRMKQKALPTLNLPALNHIQAATQKKPQHVYQKFNIPKRKVNQMANGETGEGERNNFETDKKIHLIPIAPNGTSEKPNNNITNSESIKVQAVYKRPSSSKANTIIKANMDTTGPSTSNLITNANVTKCQELSLLFTLSQKFANSSLDTFIQLYQKLKAETYEDTKVYSNELKSNILEMYYSNSQAYEILQSILCLPPISILPSFIQSTQEEINQNCINCLKSKIALSQLSEDTKYAYICLSIMKLKPNIHYDYDIDVINGVYVNTQSVVPFQYAIVAMVRGVAVDWHQILAIYFMTDLTFSQEFCSWTNMLVVSMNKIGLIIKAIVTSTDNFFIEAFTLRDQINKYIQICHVYDPLHMMLFLYEVLQKNLIVFGDNLYADWNHIKDYYMHVSKINKNTRQLHGSSSIPPNALLQDRLKSAAKILSLKTAAGIAAYVDLKLYDEKAMDTAEFLKNVSNFFSLLYPNAEAVNTNKTNIIIFKQSMTFFEKIQLLNKDKVNSIALIAKLIETFTSSLESVINLAESEMAWSFAHPASITRHMNLDPVFEFIDKITIKNNGKHTTSNELMNTIKENLLQNNCKINNQGTDASRIDTFVETARRLIKLEALRKQNMPMLYYDESHFSDYTAFEFDDANSYFYVATYILDKVVQKFKSAVSTRIKLMNSSVYYENGDSGISGSIIIPDDDFLQLVIHMDSAFMICWKKAMASGSWFQALRNEMKQVIVSAPVDVASLAYIIDLFIHLRIYHTLQYNNSAYEKVESKLYQFVVNRLNGYKLQNKVVP